MMETLEGIGAHQGIALPEPTRARWQPLRLGLVELFHYDSEEFWFEDGHLLLRGNNGTGKSKVLSLTMPFLLDAQLKSSRVEPDGDPGKRMAWNLLLGTNERRIGYTWIEFGRVEPDGSMRFLTLGAGLFAIAARQQVDSWFFLLEGAAESTRMNRDFWLTTPERAVLTKERLRDAVQGKLGQVFDTAHAYRRAVDERLFRLGQVRYEALIDTLIQLRQPQLSKKPDEGVLSNALTEALPPIPAELLADVADALGQLEDDRHQLEVFEKLASAVDRFEKRYRVYAGTQTRRQARNLRQAQTDFDSASRARHEADAKLTAARETEEQCKTAEREADLATSAARNVLETLLEDPAMQDAKGLERAEREAKNREADAVAAGQAVERQNEVVVQEEARVLNYKQRVESAQKGLSELRKTATSQAKVAGVDEAYRAVVFHAAEPQELAGLESKAFDLASTGLRKLVSDRRQGIATVRARLDDVRRLDETRQLKQDAFDEARDALEDATARGVQADEEFEQQGKSHVEAWTDHLASLKELTLSASEVLPKLADWAATLVAEHPALRALSQSQVLTARTHAEIRADLTREVFAAQQQVTGLRSERIELESGVDPVPPAPYTRTAHARENRTGAPLWKLVDFKDTADAESRRGLEAGLEASGLLDAWVLPDGRVEVLGEGAPVLDTRLVPRAAAPHSLAAWLVASCPEDCAVSELVVQAVLDGIGCGVDDGDTEAWIGFDGRYRLGPLAGAWSKPVAAYIGYSARAQARVSRIAEIDVLLEQLSQTLDRLSDDLSKLEERQLRASQEWSNAPTDTALRQAALQVSSCSREVRERKSRADQCELSLGEAVQALRTARERLAVDAQDLRLTESAEALRGVEIALDAFNDTQQLVVSTVRELRTAWPDYESQMNRERQAKVTLGIETERLAASEMQAATAKASFDALMAAVGVKVEELMTQLANARERVKESEKVLRRAGEAAGRAAEGRAVAGTTAQALQITLEEKTAARGIAVTNLQRFVTSGIFAAGLPDLAVPDTAAAWTIDPALTLARRSEQLLSEVNDSDDAWARIQRHIGEDLSELQRALSALGYQCTGEQTDFGQVVTIVYQNRPERPDRLAELLRSEVEQRRDLLTAKEREVLENHLQAEIAAAVQRLLRAADHHVNGINNELKKRPTSTGVRFRLVWQPLTEAEGAPVGLAAARERLLNTSSDLWSSEDRRVVGTMLQQRIAAERERTEAGASDDGSAALSEQLARALDYRRWHRFRVERWQDKQWRKLSGPASSGERALGLTVPLFAAVASFYGQSAEAMAPRLILLDEAFAGIDDAARSHCMALVREFDLDFIITSEREWGCYAELPGVSICQLQRKEGIDAVYVSRWVWDGNAKRKEVDPDRRFPPRQ